ncbi:MAG: hypothetical protein ACYDBB_16285 [Armatimonadota bacterium]
MNGVLLINGVGDGFVMSYPVWCWVLERANDLGWKPAGTECPINWHGDTGGFAVSPRGWDRNYMSGDGQTMSNRDAQLFADALAQLVREGYHYGIREPVKSARYGCPLPYSHPLAWKTKRVIEACTHGCHAANPPHMHFMVGLSREKFMYLIPDLIAFCRQGGVAIW